MIYREWDIPTCGYIESGIYRHVDISRVGYTDMWIYREWDIPTCGYIESGIY